MNKQKSAIIVGCCGLLLLSAGSPAMAAGEPVAHWKFDNRSALDSASGMTDGLDGNFKFMAEGVRGGCLRFDGFTTREPSWGMSSNGQISFQLLIFLSSVFMFSGNDFDRNELLDRFRLTGRGPRVLGILQ